MKSTICRPRALKFEPLELRQLLTATASDLVTPNIIVLPDASTSTISGLSPAQIKAAYGFNNITFGGVAGTGAGETIAIVDAYNDPNIVSDLATFDSHFGLAAPASFKVVNETGGTTLPENSRDWASEIALDVEWAHAIAPGASILLVEASSATDSDLDKAEDFARSASGVVVVSNSWGGSEYNGESSEDVHFTTPSGHAGVTFTVAAGDEGGGAEYPSASPDVISVGGTSLKLTSSGSYSSESVWSDGGGGTSKYEGLPSYQSGFTTGDRGTPDVSYDANPSTGVAVYDSYGSGGWAEYGGTSIGAPQWAGLIAIADQGRALAGKSSLSNAQDVLYTLPSSDFHDITSGSDGYSASSGYDLASGRGSPIANLVVSGLVAYGGSTTFTVAAPTTTTRGGGFGGGFGGGGWGGWGGWGFGGFGGFFGFDVPGGGSAAGVAATGSAGNEGGGDAAGALASADSAAAPLDATAADFNADASGNCDDSSSLQALQSNDEALQSLVAMSDDGSSVSGHNHSTQLNDASAADAAIDAFFAQLDGAASHGLANVA